MWIDIFIFLIFFIYFIIGLGASKMIANLKSVNTPILSFLFWPFVCLIYAVFGDVW